MTTQSATYDYANDWTNFMDPITGCFDWAKEQRWYRRAHLATIARLRSEIADMDGAWDVNTADGARVCAAVLFPGWSPRLDKLQYILDLTRMLYAPQSDEIRETTEQRDAERAAMKVDRTIDEWPEARQQSAVVEFLIVAEKAGVIAEKGMSSAVACVRWIEKSNETR